MTCKDCIHYEACGGVCVNTDIFEEVEKDCKEFGGKSLYIKLPCKVGDTVWIIRNYRGVKHPQRGTVSDMVFTHDMKLRIVVKYVGQGEWGKTVFATREEAEAALEGRK